MSSTPYFDAYEERRLLRQERPRTGATIRINSDVNIVNPHPSSSVAVESSSVSNITVSRFTIRRRPEYRLVKEYVTIEGQQILKDAHLEFYDLVDWVPVESRVALDA